MHKILQDIKISTNGHCNTLEGVIVLLISFLLHIGSVMKGLELKDGIESIYAQVTSRGRFLLESAIFALILSNAMPEDFITATFQTYDQIRINEINKTKNEAENKMNETENSQTEESKSTNEYPFNLIREESQESEKSPNCLTKSDIQQMQAQKN